MESICTFLRHGVVLLTTALVLAACGGGGGDGGNPIPTNQAPTAVADPLPALFLGQRLTLAGGRSSDPEGDKLTFSWRIVKAPTGSAALVSNATSANAEVTLEKAGEYTFGLAVSDGKAQSQEVTLVGVAAEPQISVNQAEPVAEVVTLSIPAALSGKVDWFVDLGQISPSESTATSVDWDTSGLANGNHAVVAQVETASGFKFEVRRTISTKNSSITTMGVTVGRADDLVRLSVEPVSVYGITKVSARFDATDLGILTAPNACNPRAGCPVLHAYLFTVDAYQVGSGTHTALITATDGSGTTRQITVPVVVDNPPRLSVTQPLDGAVVSGSLNVEGTATSDKGDVVTVTATLGDLQILQVASSPFKSSFSLAGVVAGPYQLQIKAADAHGRVTVVQRSIMVTAPAP